MASGDGSRGREFTLEACGWESAAYEAGSLSGRLARSVPLHRCGIGACWSLQHFSSIAVVH